MRQEQQHNRLGTAGRQVLQSFVRHALLPLVFFSQRERWWCGHCRVHCLLCLASPHESC